MSALAAVTCVSRKATVVQLVQSKISHAHRSLLPRTFPAMLRPDSYQYHAEGVWTLFVQDGQFIPDIRF